MPDLIRHPEPIESTGFRVKPGMTRKAFSTFYESINIWLKKEDCLVGVVMKTLIRFFWLRVFFLILCFVVVSGCSSSHKYSYNSIHEEYSNGACVLDGRQQDKVEKSICRTDKPVTLKDAIRISLVNNPDSNIAAARIKKAEAMLQQSEALFYPYLVFIPNTPVAILLHHPCLKPLIRENWHPIPTLTSRVFTGILRPASRVV
jgi:hypothetical protein